uniref:GATA zinc finger domain-containing protein 14-like n=1 Tax=Heliothis virescens TaxID=7102 RepID=A0A2A4IXL5_HELVI
MGGPVITAVLLLAVITITRGQYFDVLQGLQQLFQPQSSTDFTNQYNGFPNPQTTHKPDRRKQEDRRTKKPPINQYEYILSTTQKTTKKSKNNSSQSSRSLTNKNQYSNILLGDFFNPFDVTTKASRYKTTTTKVNPNNFYNNDDYNRGTTENVFANNFDINRPATENIFENINRGESFGGLNQPGHVYENENTRRPGNNVYESNVAGGNNDRGYSPTNNQNRGSNNPNRGVLNTDFSYDIPVTTNNRNPGVDRPINKVNSNNGYLNTDSNPDDYVQPQINPYVPKPNNRVQNQYENNYSNVGNNFNNGAINSNNNNRVNYNNQGNYDPDRITFEYPSDTPLINRPGVQPAPVDTGLPPITNRPVADRNDYDNRPSDPSGVNYDDQSAGEPEILIGPDEDDMSERQKRNYAQLAEKSEYDYIGY